MKKYKYKLIRIDQRLKEKRTIGRENVSEEILLQEVLDDIGQGGWNLIMMNGDLVGQREIDAE